MRLTIPKEIVAEDKVCEHIWQAIVEFIPHGYREELFIVVLQLFRDYKRDFMKGEVER